MQEMQHTVKFQGSEMMKLVLNEIIVHLKENNVKINIFVFIYKPTKKCELHFEVNCSRLEIGRMTGKL